MKKSVFSLSTLSLLLSFPLSPLLADSTTSYTYNTLGLVDTIDGPRLDVTDVTTYAYDTSGNLISVTNALGHITQITAHDASGRPLTLVDANGATTTMSYDARGRLLTVDTAGSLTQLTYNAVGNIILIERPDGQQLQYEYDSAQRLIGLSDALGNSINYTLDDAGNTLSESITDTSNTLRYSHHYIYDELSRLRQDIGAATQTTVIEYDVNNNATGVSDPKNQPTSYAFDALDRLTDITDADTGLTTYTYDSRNNVTSVTDARGNTTFYTYDALDNLISQDSPDTGITTYTYDEAGNRLTQTDARGITVAYSYDALNRLVSESYPDSSLNVDYVYDENATGQHGIGRLTRIVDASGETQYHYDARGNVIEKTVTLGSASYTLTYSYNAADALTAMTYPDGRQLHFSYDVAGRITQVTTTDVLGNTENVVSNVQYAPFGPMTAQTFGNGLNLVQTLDEDYRTDTLNTTTVSDRLYGYDLNSNITQINDAVVGDNQAFSYDNVDRLITADATSFGDIDYTYDANHNRTQKTQTLNALTESVSYQYESSSNQLSSVTDALMANYTYDAMGNITSNGQLSFSYNDAGRLSEVYQGSTLLATYTYNAMDQRTSKTVNSQTTYFLYGLQGELLAEVDGMGAVSSQYHFINNQLQALVKAAVGSGTPTIDLVVDNKSTYTGDWSPKTTLPGYQGSDYLEISPTPSAGPGTMGVVVDGSSGYLSSVGTWPQAFSPAGFYNNYYRYHAPTVSNNLGLLGSPVDNQNASASGSWQTATSGSDYFGQDYTYSPAGTGQNSVTWSLPATRGGFSYQVYVSWGDTSGLSLASDATYIVTHANGTDTVTLNQQQGGGEWQLLGTYTLNSSSTVTLTDDANGAVIADAVTIVREGQSTTPVTAETTTWQFPTTSTSGSYEIYANWVNASDNATDATYTISHQNGTDTVTVNQQIGGGQWQLLGTYPLDNASQVSLSSAANGNVIADAISFLPAGTEPIAIPQNNMVIWRPEEVGQYHVYASWPADTSLSDHAEYFIKHLNGVDKVTVNQQTGGGEWHLLGTYELAPYRTYVAIAPQPDATVVADAIRFVSTDSTGGGTTEEALYYVHNDHLGTPHAITDSNQQVVWQAQYTPFGKASLLVNTIDNPIRFPGQYYDEETGLHYNYFRYYDPTLGRYISSDPIGLKGGINTYSYVGGSPIIYSDPDGLCRRGYVPFNGSTTVCILDPAKTVNPEKCATSFCGAGLNSEEPMDMRTLEQTQCDSCKFACSMSTNLFAPGPFIPLTTKEVVGYAASAVGSEMFCDIVCEEDCKDCE